MPLRVIVVLGALLAVVGIGLMAAQVDKVVTATGAMAFGIGGVVLLSCAFYAVGRSEDRDRQARGR
jgi:hypothetical protein